MLPWEISKTNSVLSTSLAVNKYSVEVSSSKLIFGINESIGASLTGVIWINTVAVFEYHSPSYTVKLKESYPK